MTACTPIDSFPTMPIPPGFIFQRWVLRFSVALGLLSPCFAGLRATEPKSQFDPQIGAPLSVRDRPALGSEKARIVVVEAISYKCAHCRAFNERVFPRLRESYIDSGKVRWILVTASDDPLDAETKIFTIGRCMQRQGKFWNALDALIQNGNRPSSFLMDVMTRIPAVDGTDLSFCVQDRVVRQEVYADFADYVSLGAHGTPTFFIRKLLPDGQRTEARIEGYQSFEYFQKVFDDLLKAP